MQLNLSLVLIFIVIDCHGVFETSLRQNRGNEVTIFAVKVRTEVKI